MTDNFVMSTDPKTNVLAWRVLGLLELGDIPAISSRVKQGCATLREPLKLLVDNRFMMLKGRPIIFSPEVNAEWITLQQWLLPRCSHVAVLCNGSVMQLQMDRLAKTSGLSAVLKSFWDADPAVSRREGYRFLEIPKNALIDRVV
jgi:hypothetical protein